MIIHYDTANVYSIGQSETLQKVSQLKPEYPGWMLGFESTDRRPDGLDHAKRFQAMSKASQ